MVPSARKELRKGLSTGTALSIPRAIQAVQYTLEHVNFLEKNQRLLIQIGVLTLMLSSYRTLNQKEKEKARKE
jgi:hypothetical protein